MFIEGSWVAFQSLQSAARQRLFCFPHAGGGATAYRAWLKALPDAVQVCPVQLPGREQRLRETPINTMEALLGPLLAGLQPWLDRPFSFFGHSMGAVIAYELSHQLRRQGLPMPTQLLVSGRRAPHCSARDEQTFDLPDDEFLAKLAALNGSPREVLENTELMALMLPMLRADFQLIETYRWNPSTPSLDCPITALGGDNDPKASLEELRAWAELTRGPFQLQCFAGGHFYLQEQLEAVIRQVCESLLQPSP